MRKLKLFLLTFVALLGGVSSAVASKTVYLQPGEFANDGAVISLWIWGGSNSGSWYAGERTEVESGIYRLIVDDEITGMKVLRGNEENTWTKAEGETKGYWNQSGDLTVEAGKLYKANGYDNGTMLFSVEAYTEPVVEEPAGYTVDFNTEIATSDHAFQVASNWRHIVDTYESSWSYDPQYAYYSYSTTAGVDGSGALSCSTNQNSYSIYDLLVTPVVKGTVTIAAKATATYYTPQLSFFKITDNGDGTYTRGEQITVDVSAINASDYVTITIPVDEAGERIGIRSSYVWLDNFTATEATIIPESKISFVSATSADGNNGTTGQIKWEQQANGKVLVSYTVVVTNTGDVDLVQGDENYSISIIHRETGNVIATVPVPQDLAKGETSDGFVVSGEAESSVWPNSYTEVHMDLKENLFGSTIQRANSTYTAYEPKFVFRAAESTSTSSITAAESWGTITESTTKSFEIANTGTAPLTIKSVTLPEGFTSDNAPEAEFTLAKGETQALNITQDAAAQGTFAGNLAIVYLDKDGAEQTYTLAFSATVIGENTWTADFNNTTSTAVFPEGSIKENGITTDWDNKTADGKYNIYLKGYNTTSYQTENNKFITPKLHANAGDKLAFDVKAGYSSSDDYFVKVYVSADRQNWGEPVETYVYSTVGSSFTTKTISFDEAGDYYVAFAIYGTSSAIDNLVGLEKVDVAHDLYIKSVSWPDASIKSGTAQTKPSVDIIPLTNEDAENYTVKYIYGDNEVEIASKALTASASSTTSFSASFTPEVEETTTFSGTKVVFEFTDGTKFETETFDLTVTNEAIFHFLNSVPSSKWYEPTDRTAPIAFGKTNTADTQNFVIFNWGSAPLTVNSISLPDGFTTTTEFPLTVAAFNGENDGLAAASQALDIVFSAETAGTYSGDMVITYSGDQTFTLAVSGTKLDPNKFYATFGTSSDASNYPAGSLAQANVSITTPTTDNGALVSSSSTKNLFITPKLATTGENVQFDAKVRSSWYEGSVKVYSVTDNIAAAETTTDAEFEALSPTLLGEFTIGTDVSSFTTYSVEAPAGEYYLAFKIADVQVDEIYGMTVVPVAHDLTLATSTVPAEGTQNAEYTASVYVKNFGIADDEATVTAYVNDVAVATSAAVAIPMNHKLTDAGTALSVSFVYPKAGEYPVYLELKAGETVIGATDPVDVVFAEEVALSEAIEVGSGTTTSYNYAPIDFYNFEQARTSDILYTAAQLTAFGLKSGDKITTLAFKGTASSAKTIVNSSLKAWVALSSGDITYGSPDKTAMTEVTVFNAGEMVFVAGTNMVTINLPENITYDGTSDLRIYLEGGGNSEYVSLYFAYDTNYSNMKWSNATSMKYNPLLYVTLEAQSATLAGTVKTSSADGIEGATITLKADNGVEYSGTTAADGSYSINVIQAGLDFTATVEAEGYLKRQFALNMNGTSATSDVTLYTQIGIVGDAGMGLDWDNDKVMTQSDEDPNIFTLVVDEVAIAAGTYEYKLRADGAWNLVNKYQLPDEGNQNWVFGTDMYPAGKYKLTFTADMTNHTLELAPELLVPTGISNLDTTNTLDGDIYNIGGVRSDKLQRGQLNIIRTKDGKVRKVVIK